MELTDKFGKTVNLNDNIILGEIPHLCKVICLMGYIYVSVGWNKDIYEIGGLIPASAYFNDVFRGCIIKIDGETSEKLITQARNNSIEVKDV